MLLCEKDGFVHQPVCSCLHGTLPRRTALSDGYMATGFYSKDSFSFTHGFVSKTGGSSVSKTGVQEGPAPGRGAQTRQLGKSVWEGTCSDTCCSHQQDSEEYRAPSSCALTIVKWKKPSGWMYIFKKVLLRKGGWICILKSNLRKMDKQKKKS